jgi:hypothetical protein
MTQTTKVDKYQVLYSANTFVPRVQLFNAGKQIGELYFQPDGSTLPPDKMSGTIVQLFYHREDYENVIDLLRNQQPIYLWYNGSGGGFENGIKTFQ